MPEAPVHPETTRRIFDDLCQAVRRESRLWRVPLADNPEDWDPYVRTLLFSIAYEFGVLGHELDSVPARLWQDVAARVCPHVLLPAPARVVVRFSGITRPVEISHGQELYAVAGPDEESYPFMTDRALQVLTHVPSGILARVGESFPSVTLREIPEEGELPDDVRGEVLLTQAWGSLNAARVMERGVRWVHAYGTGVNAFPFGTLGECPLTCSRGASAIPISEWVLAVMLAEEKQLPDAWVQEPPGSGTVVQSASQLNPSTGQNCGGWRVGGGNVGRIVAADGVRGPSHVCSSTFPIACCALVP